MNSLIFLLQSALIIVFPYLIWRSLKIQKLVPLVVVQILTGIVIGPSVLGLIAPDFHGKIFQPIALESLTGIASLGILLFSFISGLHLGSYQRRDSSIKIAVIGLFSFLVPLSMGFLAGFWLYTSVSGELGNSSRLNFSLGIGISSAVTALPVLSAILRETGLINFYIGQLSLRLAATNDALIWIIISAVLGSNIGKNFLGFGPSMLISFSFSYVLVMLFLVRPWLFKIFEKISPAEVGDAAIVGILGLVFFSAVLTEALGLHYVIGGFLAGVVMPPDIKKVLIDRLENATTAILVPFFFTITGIKTYIDISSSIFLKIFALILAVSILGKMIGTSFPARIFGSSWRDALALGTLMQTKGLMEIVVLTVLLEAGIIGQSVFSALVTMALVSTVLATPLTSLVLGRNTYRTHMTPEEG